jgi:hypothetical protein
MSAKNTFCCWINHSTTAEAGAITVILTEFSDPQGPLLLDLKFKYLHVQCNLLLLNLRSCTPKSKTNIWVNALIAVILLHDNICPHAAQLNGVQWVCSSTVHTAWTFDHVIFTGLDTFWKSSNSAHSCQIMMSRRLWYNNLDSCTRNSMHTASAKCQHVRQWESCPSSYADFSFASTFTCEHPPIRVNLTCLIRYHIGHPLE